jgi:hypothetical protein
MGVLLARGSTGHLKGFAALPHAALVFFLYDPDAGTSS